MKTKKKNNEDDLDNAFFSFGVVAPTILWKCCVYDHDRLYQIEEKRVRHVKCKSINRNFLHAYRGHGGRVHFHAQTRVYKSLLVTKVTEAAPHRAGRWKKERDLSTACEQWSMHTVHVGRQQFRKLNNIDVSRSPQPGSNSQKTLRTWQSCCGQEDPWQYIDRLQHWIFIENDRLWIGKKTGSKKQTLDLDACKHAPVRLRLPSEMAVRKLRSESRTKFMFAPVER